MDLMPWRWRCRWRRITSITFGEAGRLNQIDFAQYSRVSNSRMFRACIDLVRRLTFLYPLSGPHKCPARNLRRFRIQLISAVNKLPEQSFELLQRPLSRTFDFIEHPRVLLQRAVCVTCTQICRGLFLRM